MLIHVTPYTTSMQVAPLPPDETERLRVLHRLAILDTAPEDAFDRITRVLAHMLGVPIALVSLIDEHRQWFKSRVGREACETPRGIAFCSHALLESDMLVVEAARTDPRFCDNPLVNGPLLVVFYAGVPLRSGEGHAIGTLCAIDTFPRVLSTAALAPSAILRARLSANWQRAKRLSRRERCIKRMRTPSVFGVCARYVRISIIIFLVMKTCPIIST